VTAGPPQSPAAAADQWLLRFRSTLVAILGAIVAGIACLAFFTSFEAIRAYAMRSAGIAPEHAWAIPLLVDSFIIVATGADLWFVTTARQRKWWEIIWPKLLLCGAAAVSFVLNVAHANHNWAARGVAAIPPAALVLGVELLMMVLRRATAMRASRLQEEAYEFQAALAGQLAVTTHTQAPPALGPGQGPAPAAEEHVSASIEREVEPPAPQPQRPAGPPPRPTPARTPAAAAGARPGGPRLDRPAAPPANARTRTTLVVDAGSELAPRTAAPLTAVGSPLGEVRPSATRRTASRVPAPYLEASRILDEREDGATMTPEGLVEALAAEGVVVDLRTARGLLRELRPAVTALQSLQRPSRAAPGGATAADHPAGTANGARAGRDQVKTAPKARQAPAGREQPEGNGRPVGLVQAPEGSTR
jgi:Protein of unknown function (DUF2637)